MLARACVSACPMETNTPGYIRVLECARVDHRHAWHEAKFGIVHQEVVCPLLSPDSFLFLLVIVVLPHDVRAELQGIFQARDALLDLGAFLLCTRRRATFARQPLKPMLDLLELSFDFLPGVHERRRGRAGQALVGSRR